MELDYAFLADKAGSLDDGKLVVFGGDIDKAIVPKLPALIQSMIVARLRLSPDESLESHVFGLECTPPDGMRLVIAEGMAINTQRNAEEPDQPSSARLFIALAIAAEVPGAHLIHLMIDGREMKTMRFRVILVPHQEEAK